LGNRIEKKIDADGNGSWETTQRYALDGWKNVHQALVGNENWDVWADLNGSGSLTTRYVRGDVIDQLFARIESGGTAYWYLTDHLGSIRDVIDSSAVVKDSITYDGFGNITAETASNYRGRYAWTGRETDFEIGSQYNRMRFYDPSSGRWFSQDPMGFDAGDSNLYRYCANQPASSTDPSGLFINPIQTFPNTPEWNYNVSKPIKYPATLQWKTVSVFTDTTWFHLKQIFKDLVGEKKNGGLIVTVKAWRRETKDRGLFKEQMANVWPKAITRYLKYGTAVPAQEVGEWVLQEESSFWVAKCPDDLSLATLQKLFREEYPHLTKESPLAAQDPKNLKPIDPFLEHDILKPIKNKINQQFNWESMF
jgi:RHS repeat-associated protein